MPIKKITATLPRIMSKHWFGNILCFGSLLPTTKNFGWMASFLGVFLFVGVADGQFGSSTASDATADQQEPIKQEKETEVREKVVKEQSKVSPQKPNPINPTKDQLLYNENDRQLSSTKKPPLPGQTFQSETFQDQTLPPNGPTEEIGNRSNHEQVMGSDVEEMNDDVQAIQASDASDAKPQSSQVDQSLKNTSATEDKNNQQRVDHIVFWSSIGVAGAGIISGTILGSLAISQQASFNKNPSTAKADRGERLALFADVSFGFAAVATATAAMIYFSSEDPEESSTDSDEQGASDDISWRLAPAVSAQQAVIQGQLRF